MAVAYLNASALPQVNDQRRGGPGELQGVQERHISAVALLEHGHNLIDPLLGRQHVGAAVGDVVDLAGDVDDGGAHRRAHFGHIVAPVRGVETRRFGKAGAHVTVE